MLYLLSNFVNYLLIAADLSPLTERDDVHHEIEGIQKRDNDKFFHCCTSLSFHASTAWYIFFFCVLRSSRDRMRSASSRLTITICPLSLEILIFPLSRRLKQ